MYICHKILTVWHLSSQKCPERYQCCLPFALRHHVCNDQLSICSRLSATEVTLLVFVCPRGCGVWSLTLGIGLGILDYSRPCVQHFSYKSRHACSANANKCFCMCSTLKVHAQCTRVCEFQLYSFPKFC